MENYIKINLELLKRKDLSPTEKLIISFLQSYQSNKKYYYAGIPKLSKELGLPYRTVIDNINKLEDKKLLFKCQDKKYIKYLGYNKNAIILVDEDNPYPTNDTSKIKSEDTSGENDSEIPKEDKKFITEEINMKEKITIKNNYGQELEIKDEYKQFYLQHIKGIKPSIEKKLKTKKLQSLLDSELDSIYQTHLEYEKSINEINKK